MLFPPATRIYGVTKARRHRTVLSNQHPEVVDWLQRIAIKGGTVSTSSLTAVSQWLTDVKASSGLRSCVKYALLFCGDFTASLVPLIYETGAPYCSSSGITSTNYVETGISGGIALGNPNTTKVLWPFLNVSASIQNAPTRSSFHLAYYLSNVVSTANSYVFGNTNAGATQTLGFAINFAGTTYMDGFSRTDNVGRIHGLDTGSNAFWIATRSGSNQGIYRASTSSSQFLTVIATGVDTVTTDSPPDFSSAACPLGNDSTGFVLDAYSTATFKFFSFGWGLSYSQSFDLFNATQKFQNSLTRHVP